MSLKNNYLKLTKSLGGPYALIDKGIKKGLITSILQDKDTRLSSIRMIAKALEVPVELLIAEEHEPQIKIVSEQPESYGFQGIEEHLLISQYRKLSPEERPFIKKLMEIFQGANEQDKVSVKYNIDSFHRNKDTVTRVEADYVKDARKELKKTEAGNSK